MGICLIYKVDIRIAPIFLDVRRIVVSWQDDTYFLYQIMDEPVVLVAEDNQLLRQQLARQLEQLGVRVLVVSNGHEAVKEVTEGKFSLVLMDVNMPELDGLEATKAIRDFERSNNRVHTPIVAVTAFAECKDCLAAGMDDCVKKPLSLPDLKNLLLRYVFPVVKEIDSAIYSDPARGQ